jgi:hypothetical protein
LRKQRKQNPRNIAKLDGNLVSVNPPTLTSCLLYKNNFLPDFQVALFLSLSLFSSFSLCAENPLDTVTLWLFCLADLLKRDYNYMVTDRLRDIWVVAKVIHSKRLENEALGSSFGFANYLIQYKIHFSWRSWRKQKKPNLIYFVGKRFRSFRASDLFQALILQKTHCMPIFLSDDRTHQELSQGCLIPEQILLVNLLLH